MSVIGTLERAWTYVSGDSKPAAAPAPATAGATTAPVSTISNQTNAGSAPSSSSGVTNAQGHAARLALGSTGAGPGRFEDIPPPEVGARYDSSLTTVGQPALRPGTPASRLEDLKSISQLDGNKKTTNDEQRCGASSIVAGAYYAGGTDGVKKLIDDQQAYAKSHNLKGQDPYFGDKELKKRVESGKMTNDDINKVQDNLHKTLAERDKQVRGDGIKGIHRDEMREFMNEATNTKKAFDEKGLVIAHIDTDRKDGGNHYVLAGQHDGKPFVYDPYSIKDEQTQDLNQVTTDPGQLRIYRDSMVPVNGQKYVYSGNNVPYSRN